MAVGDLTTLATAKAWIGVTDSSQDQAIARLISVYSQAVQSYLGRTVGLRVTTEIRDGTGGKMLVPRAQPIVAIQEILIDGRSIPADDGAGTRGWRVVDNFILLTGGLIFTRARGNVEITLQAGYSPVPPAIEQAVLTALHGGLLAKERDPNISSDSVPGVYSVSYGPVQQLPQTAVEMLEPYKKRFF